MMQDASGHTEQLGILLVEDNAVDADLLRLCLQRAHNSQLLLRHVESLADAIQKVTEENFHVVLLDLQLPDTQGTGGVEALRAVASNVPIVVLTRENDEEMAFRCIAAGAQDFLSKDEFNETKLRRVIRFAVLRLRELQEKMELLRQLETALTKILSGYVTICMHCKKIRVDENWQAIESYVEGRSDAKFTHGVCPDCVESNYPKFADKTRNR